MRLSADISVYEREHLKYLKGLCQRDFTNQQGFMESARGDGPTQRARQR